MPEGVSDFPRIWDWDLRHQYWESAILELLSTAKICMGIISVVSQFISSVVFTHEEDEGLGRISGPGLAKFLFFLWSSCPFREL